MGPIIATARTLEARTTPSPPHCNGLNELQWKEVREESNFMSEGMEAGLDSRSANAPESNKTLEELSKSDYGPWMLMSRR